MTYTCTMLLDSISQVTTYYHLAQFTQCNQLRNPRFILHEHVLRHHLSTRLCSCNKLIHGSVPINESPCTCFSIYILYITVIVIVVYIVAVAVLVEVAVLVAITVL